MRNRRHSFWATWLLVVLFVLSGCATRSGVDLADGPVPGMVVDLPAVVVDIAQDGTASVANVPVAQLAQLAGFNLGAFSIPTAWVDFLVSGNIQHIQVNNTDSGLLILVNGEPIPSIAYDGNSLTTTADALSALGMAVPMLDQILPVIAQIGIGVIVHLPVAEGMAAIPLYVNGDGSAAAAAQQAQAQFLATIGAPPRVNLPVFYAADGSWRVGNLTDTEWTALTGIPFYVLRVNPTVLRGLGTSGVSNITISTSPRGIQIAVNGNPLPTLTWGNGELQHLLGLAGQTGLLEMVAPGMNMNEILATVHQMLPVVTTTDFDLTVHIPDQVLARR